MINLNKLFPKPANPVLSLGSPTAKHPGKVRLYVTYEDSSVSVFELSLPPPSPPPPLFFGLI